MVHGNTTQIQINNQINQSIKVTMNFQASTFDCSKAGLSIKEVRCVAYIPNALAKRARFQELLGFEKLVLLESEKS
jgi:hypothetical protein